MISDRKILEQYAPPGSLIFVRDYCTKKSSMHLLINWYVVENDLKIMSLCNGILCQNSYTVFGRMLVKPNDEIIYTDVYVLVKS